MKKRRQKKQTKKPDFIVYQVQENEKNSYWTRIGAAWSHGDGEGFNIQLNALPLDGRLTVRTPSEEDDEE